MARGALGRGGKQLVEAPAFGGRLHLGEAPQQLAFDQHLGKGQHAGPLRELDPALRVLGEGSDLGERRPV